MLLPIFCPAQIKQPLDQSPPRRWQTQWILKRWPLSKIVAQKRSICRAAHTLNWLSPDSSSMPGWRCFHWQFSPNCSPQILLLLLQTFYSVLHNKLYNINNGQSYGLIHAELTFAQQAYRSAVQGVGYELRVTFCDNTRDIHSV